MVLDVENEILSDEEQDFKFTKNVPMSPEEILRSLNMDEPVGEDDDREPFIYCQGNSFNELKDRMEDIVGNKKVFSSINIHSIILYFYYKIYYKFLPLYSFSVNYLLQLKNTSD